MIIRIGWQDKHLKKNNKVNIVRVIVKTKRRIIYKNKNICGTYSDIKNYADSSKFFIKANNANNNLRNVNIGKEVCITMEKTRWMFAFWVSKLYDINRILLENI